MLFLRRRSLELVLFLAPVAVLGCFGPTAGGKGSRTPGIAPLGEAAVEIRKGTPERERIRLAPRGIAYGRIGGAVERAVYSSDDVREELAALTGAYAPFNLVVGSSRIRFLGRGAAEASPAERRRISEWALFLAAESSGAGDGVPAPILFWQRGGEGEACDRLGIDRTAAVSGGACGGLETSRRLAGADLEKLYGWFDRLGPFETSWLEGPPDEQRTFRMVFAGAGRSGAGERERAEIAVWAAEVAADLKLEGSPRFAPAPRRLPPAPLALPVRSPMPPLLPRTSPSF